MPTFAEIKAKAVKAKDAGLEKIQQTKDRNTSVPIAKTNWDPHNKTSPRPPPRPTPANPPRSTTGSLPPPPAYTRSVPPVIVAKPPSISSALPPPAPPRLPVQISSPSAVAGPPPINRSSHPDHGSSSPFPPSAPSLVPRSRPRVQTANNQAIANDEIDWANLSEADKKVFFEWLDEFFLSRFPPSGNPAVAARQ